MAKHNANKTRRGKKSPLKKVVKSARKSRKVRKSRKNAIFGGHFFNNSKHNEGKGLDLVEEVLGEENLAAISKYINSDISPLKINKKTHPDELERKLLSPSDLIKQILQGMYDAIEVDKIGIASYNYRPRKDVRGNYGLGVKTIGPIIDENTKHSIFGRLGTNINITNPDDKDEKLKKRIVVLLFLLVFSSADDNELMVKLNAYKDAYARQEVEKAKIRNINANVLTGYKDPMVVGNKASQFFKAALRKVLIKEYEEVKELVRTRDELNCNKGKCNYWVVYNYKNNSNLSSDPIKNETINALQDDIKDKSDLKEGETTFFQDYLKDKPFFIFEFYQGAIFKSLTKKLGFSSRTEPGFTFTSRAKDKDNKEKFNPLTIENYKNGDMWVNYHQRLTF